MSMAWATEIQCQTYNFRKKMAWLLLRHAFDMSHNILTTAMFVQLCIYRCDNNVCNIPHRNSQHYETHIGILGYNIPLLFT
jgi:hypothetical protein